MDAGVLAGVQEDRREGDMKLPELIRIGPHDVTIKAWTSSEANSHGASGWFSSSELQIRVDASQPNTVQVEVLLHEINHAIYQLFSLAQEDVEEKTVGAFAVGYTQVFRDNPQLRKWFDAMLGK